MVHPIPKQPKVVLKDEKNCLNAETSNKSKKANLRDAISYALTQSCDLAKQSGDLRQLLFDPGEEGEDQHNLEPPSDMITVAMVTAKNIQSALDDIAAIREYLGF